MSLVGPIRQSAENHGYGRSEGGILSGLALGQDAG
jgi:hypothetical protein